jgi:hypothetical protein
VDPLDASMIVVSGPDPAVAQPVQEQRARQPVLEAARRMGRFVLEIERDPWSRRQRHPQQMRV